MLLSHYNKELFGNLIIHLGKTWLQYIWTLLEHAH